MLSLNSSTTTSKSENLVDTLDCTGKSVEEITSTFLKNGVAYHPQPIFTPSEIMELQKMSKSAFNDLISEQLKPRGLSLNAEFDFNEVRHRPGNRLDNRYKIDPTIILENEEIIKIVNSIFGESDAGKVKLLYSGIVHSFPKKEGADNTPQVWHRDGPSLVNGVENRTHCLNLFIPLINVNENNGSTEFVPTTHQDAQFEKLAPEIIKSNELDEFYLHPTAIKPSCEAGGWLAFDIRTMHRGGCNFSDSNR